MSLRVGPLAAGLTTPLVILLSMLNYNPTMITPLQETAPTPHPGRPLLLLDLVLLVFNTLAQPTSTLTPPLKQVSPPKSFTANPKSPKPKRFILNQSSPKKLFLNLLLPEKLSSNLSLNNALFRPLLLENRLFQDLSTLRPRTSNQLLTIRHP